MTHQNISSGITPLVFTDLDGTLLDHHTYSFEAAQPAIDFLKGAGIPWIFNTSKTLSELLPLANRLDNQHPMIVENGGGIALPQDYPDADLSDIAISERVPGDSEHPTADGYRLITLGAARTLILEVLADMRSSFAFTGASQMSTSAFAAVTNLDEAQSGLALERYFSEPLIWHDSEQKLSEFASALALHGLHLLHGGRFVHVIGNRDKGRAMRWLCERCWGQADNGVVTIALGDSDNDVAMLEASDYPIVIRSPVHPPPPIKHVSVRISNHIGPAGWTEMLFGVLDELGYAVPAGKDYL